MSQVPNATEKEKLNIVWRSECCINCFGDHLVQHRQFSQNYRMCQDKHHILLHRKEHNLEASTFFNSKSSNIDNGAGVGDLLKVSHNCVQIENPANHVNLDDQSVINSLSSQVSQDSKLKVRLKIVPVTVWFSGSNRCCNTFAF